MADLWWLVAGRRRIDRCDFGRVFVGVGGASLDATDVATDGDRFTSLFGARGLAAVFGLDRIGADEMYD